MDDALLADLAAEQQVLDELVADLDVQRWERSTSSPGWNVLDQIHHLAVSEQAAHTALCGRSAELFGRSGRWPSTQAPPTGREALAAWRDNRRRSLERFATLDAADPVVWGAGPMTARSFATSRLMETWAHGLDCHEALGVAPVDTARLDHVAHIAYRALPYAHALAGEEMPAPLDDLRLVLRGPRGVDWIHGPEEATQTITGSAGDWCRVAVRRRSAAASDLVADGPLAESSLRLARAYLADGSG